MQSNSERGETTPQSRSRVGLGAESPKVLCAGVRRYGRVSGFSFQDTAPLVSLEMTPERVRRNLAAAAKLTP